MRKRTEKFGYGLLSLALGGVLALSGCKSNSAAPIVDMNNGPDPAAANLAQVNPNEPTGGTVTSGPVTKVLGQQAYPPPAQSSGEEYPESNQSGYYDQYADPAYDQSQVDAGAQTLYAQDAPPPLPEYQQPELTDPGDLWTPGYWAYAPSGYYWVPGAWVAPPYTGALWTPAYWGYCGRRYCFHGGYWGRHIGFYGGISYGFGYFGHGYEGGYWNNNQFFYNQRVNRINLQSVRNVYVRNVDAANTRVSYNGPGGIQARPQAAELAVLHERRTPPMQTQVAQIRAASTNRQQFFAENHGRPAVAVAAARYTADRTPPAAIEPRANEVRGNPAVVNQQQMRNEQAQRQRGVQAQQQRNVQEQQQRNVPQQAAQRNLQQEQQQHVAQQAQQRQLQQQPAARGTMQQNRSPEAQRAVEPTRAAPQPMQNRPQPQAVPQRTPPPAARPEQMARPQPEPQRAAPQPMARPEPQRAAPQPAARPEPQRAAPPPRPQPEARPAPAPHPAPAAAPHPPENHPEHPHH
jgi:hypothetical protein